MCSLKSTREYLHEQSQEGFIRNKETFMKIRYSQISRQLTCDHPWTCLDAASVDGEYMTNVQRNSLVPLETQSSRDFPIATHPQIFHPWHNYKFHM